MRKEQILLMTGVLGIVFSLIVGYFSKTEEGRKMYSATYESMIDAGKTSTSVMLAAASAGLIQGVLTMTGLVTSLGYKLVSLTAGNLWLLLLLTMVFSLILGMGVPPTTANYIITSLVAAPAIYNAVLGLQPYSSPRTRLWNSNSPPSSTLLRVLLWNFSRYNTSRSSGVLCGLC